MDTLWGHVGKWFNPAGTFFWERVEKQVANTRKVTFVTREVPVGLFSGKERESGGKLKNPRVYYLKSPGRILDPGTVCPGLPFTGLYRCMV